MKIWDKIIRVSVILGAIIFILTSIYNGYSSYNKRVIEKERKLQSEIIQSERFAKLIKSDSLKNVIYNNISDTLRLVIKQQNQLIKQQGKVNIAITNHLKLSDKIDELINYYELK
jgi:hypothetical protein